MPKLAEDVALIEPLFWVPKPGASIDLARGVVSLESGAFKAKGEGIARLATAPDNQVVITAMLPTDTMAWLRRGDDGRGFLLRFGPTGRPAKVLCRRYSTTDAGEVSLDLILQTGTVSRFRDVRIRLASVLVHVMNFPHFLGRSDFHHVDGNGGRTRLGRILMTDNVWSVELQEHLGTRAIIDKLKSYGGNAITHVARINRTDGQSFSIKDAEALIYKLHQFLSFARGHWTPLFGATGYNARGEKFFEQWGNQFSTPWMPRSGWFDVHHAECLEDLFPDFMRARDSHANGAALSKALYWFVRSNGGGSMVGTDGALILSQAALEGLAVTSLAAAGLPTAGTAADRIRRMCTNLKIPIRIPAELKHLSSGYRKKQWVDGPEALTKVRNGLVHDAAPDNVLLRQRAMLDLAERGVQSLGKGIPTRSLAHASHPHIPALEADRIVRGEMGNRSYSFTHDIFFEWVFFRLLLELGPQWVNAIIEAGEPPLLGRVVGLLAQHSLGTNGEWTKGLRLLEGSTLRPQWRREWLTAPPFTAAFDDALQEFEQVVFADDFALLEKVLVWFQAQHTTPSPVILAQPSVADGSTDKLRVADLLGWPSDFTSWERFIRWLLAHKDRLATRLLPMVLEVFGVWQNACADLKHPVSKLIVDAAEGWLIDLEQVKYADDRRFNHGKWDALGRSESVERFETSLRQLLLRAARAFPKPAIAIYDRAVSNKAMREKAYGDLVGYAVILADVAPDRVVTIAKAKILEELPRDRLAREERERRERLDRLQRLRAIPENERTPDQQKAIDLAPMSVSMFAQNSLRRDEIGIERFGNEYFPPSALEQPLDALFSQKPEHGLELVKALADHATKGWVQLQELNGHTPIAVQVDFPWGRQRFWGSWEIYSWALGQLAPPALECAFLSLAHWAHKQIEGGRATDDVIRDVVEGCESYAVLGLALTLAHETWTVSDTTLSLMTCQRLWEHDLARVVQAPTRDIEIPAFGLIDRLKGDKAEAKKYLAGRPSNQRDVRRLAMLFALSSDENIREQFRAALAAFPEDLPFEFEEERSDTGIAAGLREKAERWAGLGDSVNYRRWDDEKQAYIQYEPPGGTTPAQEKRLADATTYLHEQAVLGWATRYLETGVPRDGITLASAIAFARDKDTPKLFKQRLDVGNHTAQSVVSVIAACVMRYGDDAANMDWALGVLRRVESMKELPDQFEGAHIPWHPANHLVVALSELRKRNPTDGKLVERLLALTNHPLDDVAKLAKFALLRDPDIAVSWIIAQLCFDQALSYRPIIRRDGRRDRTTEKKAYAKAQGRAKRRLKHNTVEAFDALPDPWAKSSTRRKGRAWEDENNWVDPDPYFYSKEVADLAGEFPMEAWLLSACTRSLLENALEQWVRWTAEKLMPAGKEHNVSDRAAADTLDWSRALGDMLARVAPLLDKVLMARLIAPFLVEGDAALAVLARFTDRLVRRHVLDAAVIPDGTIDLLGVCLDRVLQDRVFWRGWRAGELHGHDLPQILDALLFVNVERAPLAARFVNGDWTQIAIIMPLVSRIVEQIGWSTAVAGRYLKLCERAGAAYPVATFADQANAILRVVGSHQERWTSTLLPARMASIVQRLAEANYPLEPDTAKRLLTVLDGLVDLGDRRSAALEQSEAFRRVQGSSS